MENMMGPQEVGGAPSRSAVGGVWGREGLTVDQMAEAFAVPAAMR